MSFRYFSSTKAKTRLEYLAICIMLLILWPKAVIKPEVLAEKKNWKKKLFQANR